MANFGFSNVINGISGASTFLNTLFNGGPITLGSFSFQGHEVPEKIRLGGNQLNTAHTRPGGQKQIDAMGEQPLDIDWSGIFLSADASSRALQLDTLRKSGKAYKLTFGSFCYTVVIDSLELDYHRATYITYKIACNVIPAMPTTTSPGLLGGLLGGLSSAVGQVTGMVTTLSNIIPGLGKISGILGTINGGIGALGTLNNTVTNLVSGGGIGQVLNNVTSGGLFSSIGGVANSVVNGGIGTLVSNVTGGISSTLSSGFNGILQSTGLSGVLTQIGGVLTGGTIQTAAALQGVAQPLQAVSAIAGGSAGAAALLPSVSLAQTASNAVASISNNAIAGLNQVATNFSSMAVPQMAATLTALNQAVSTAPVMQTVAANLGVMSRNLTNPANG